MLYQINTSRKTATTGARSAPVPAVLLFLLILYSVFQVLSNYYTQNLPLGCFGLNNLGFCQQPRLIFQSGLCIPWAPWGPGPKGPKILIKMNSYIFSKYLYLTTLYLYYIHGMIYITMLVIIYHFSLYFIYFGVCFI